MLKMEGLRSFASLLELSWVVGWLLFIHLMSEVTDVIRGLKGRWKVSNVKKDLAFGEDE